MAGQAGAGMGGIAALPAITSATAGMPQAGGLGGMLGMAFSPQAQEFQLEQQKQKQELQQQKAQTEIMQQEAEQKGQAAAREQLQFLGQMAGANANWRDDPSLTQAMEQAAQRAGIVLPRDEAGAIDIDAIPGVGPMYGSPQERDWWLSHSPSERAKINPGATQAEINMPVIPSPQDKQDALKALQAALIQGTKSGTDAPIRAVISAWGKTLQELNTVDPTALQSLLDDPAWHQSLTFAAQQKAAYYQTLGMTKTAQVLNQGRLIDGELDKFKQQIQSGKVLDTLREAQTQRALADTQSTLAQITPKINKLTAESNALATQAGVNIQKVKDMQNLSPRDRINLTNQVKLQVADLQAKEDQLKSLTSQVDTLTSGLSDPKSIDQVQGIDPTTGIPAPGSLAAQVQAAQQAVQNAAQVLSDPAVQNMNSGAAARQTSGSGFPTRYGTQQHQPPPGEKNAEAIEYWKKLDNAGKKAYRNSPNIPPELRDYFDFLLGQ